MTKPDKLRRRLRRHGIAHIRLQLRAPRSHSDMSSGSLLDASEKAELLDRGALGRAVDAAMDPEVPAKLRTRVLEGWLQREATAIRDRDRFDEEATSKIVEDLVNGLWRQSFAPAVAAQGDGPRPRQCSAEG